MKHYWGYQDFVKIYCTYVLFIFLNAAMAAFWLLYNRTR